MGERRETEYSHYMEKRQMETGQLLTGFLNGAVNLFEIIEALV